jgi:hypothetical protein
MWKVSDVGRAKIYRAEPPIYDLIRNKVQIAFECMGFFPMPPHVHDFVVPLLVVTEV